MNNFSAFLTGVCATTAIYHAILGNVAFAVWTAAVALWGGYLCWVATWGKTKSKEQ